MKSITMSTCIILDQAVVDQGNNTTAMFVSGTRGRVTVLKDFTHHEVDSMFSLFPA